jgi:hypothetical protein
MNGDTLVNRTDARLFAQVFGRSALVDPPGPPPADASPRAADAAIVAVTRGRDAALVEPVARARAARREADASENGKRDVRREIRRVDAAFGSLGLSVDRMFVARRGRIAPRVFAGG